MKSIRGADAEGRPPMADVARDTVYTAVRVRPRDDRTTVVSTPSSEPTEVSSDGFGLVIVLLALLVAATVATIRRE